MSGISPLSPGSPGAGGPTGTPAAAPTAPTQAPSVPAPATDAVKVGAGTSASSGLSVYQAKEVIKEQFPVLPPAPQIRQESSIELKPYISAPMTRSEIQPQELHVAASKPKVPIQNNHFSLIEGPAVPDP